MTRLLIVYCLLGGMLIMFFPVKSFGDEIDSNKYPYSLLTDAFEKIGFNPKVQGSSFFVVTADLHYNDLDSESLEYIIDDIHAMDHRPVFLCVNGDLICHASTSFGTVPDVNQYEKAVNEFKLFKTDIDLLDKKIPVKLVLGNHDMSPQQIEPNIFWTVFARDQYPAYQSIDINGIHLIFLNGHSTGYIDLEQMTWIEEDIRLISKKQHVIVFVHQPALSHRVRERGIPAAIKKIFMSHEGMIWLIGGHEHSNFQHVYKLPHTLLIQHGITTGSDKVWGGEEKPGYWIYCLQNGEVKGRIYKQQSHGYRIEGIPDFGNVRKIPTPFDNCTNILWKVLTGEGEEPFLVDVNAGNCLNYWAYVKNIIYKLPLSEADNVASSIALLCDYDMKSQKKEGQYFLSLNLKDWEEISLGDSVDDVLLFSIPESLKNEDKIYFKFIPQDESAVAGIALLK